jgi:hypothetical protein
VFWVLQQHYASGSGITGEVQSLTFQDENPRPGLNWLYLAISFVDGIVLRAETIFRVKAQDL